MNAWGIHSIFNLYRCCPISIRNRNTIACFSADLVKRIDMVPYGPPQIVHFGVDGKAGYTLVQLIETSNIMAHFVEETNDAYIDVFSCKEYNTNDVLKCIQDYFKPVSVQVVRMERKAELK